MSGNIAIGIQDFSTLIQGNYFYIDKTPFIKEWWDCGDSATLITRPRRFGKTLTMSMVEQFFSIDYAGRSDLFEHLAIWQDEKYRDLQGTYPVISLSFANIKEPTYELTRQKICQLLSKLYTEHVYILESGILRGADITFFQRMLTTSENMNDVDATLALYQLSSFIYQYYGKKKVIILLDEYDTPMQEAFVDGYWDQLVRFTRSLFNSTFKTNPWLERGIMTGITRVSRESIFSDLNNLKVVTTTSDEYAAAFGFTEEEVFSALDRFQIGEEKEKVKLWYDGFIFGNHKDIYNPWSILNFIDTKTFKAFWANTSANSLVGKLIREAGHSIKEQFELLLHGESIRSVIDEQIVYNQLNGSERAIWSMLLASGYLKVLHYEKYDEIPEGTQPKYELALTNLEVNLMFQNMIHAWFDDAEQEYNDFINALLENDVDAMNEYMNEVALHTFSSFDTGKQPSVSKPEKFYHGFVLGLLVDLQDHYYLTSNRESGFGRYDVMIEPKQPAERDAYIIEFKVFNARREKNLEDTVETALAQIKEKRYVENLVERGIAKEHIHCYAFAFEGKKVLIEASTDRS